jgi:hypothetical protein
MELCDKNVPHAKNAIKKIVGDAPKEQWTPEQIKALEEDIAHRKSELQQG